jgi:dihydrofolate reductase
MRKVITAAFVSMDGVMQAPGGPEEDPTQGFEFGGWVAPLADEEFGKAVDKLFKEPFDLLLGRRTYEIFAAHWPYMEDGPDAKIAKMFNRVTKYVATRSGMKLDWKGSVALEDAATDVARLKREDGPALVTQGSSNLIQTLLAHDLVDEIHTFTFPIVLGVGKKLFGTGTAPSAFKLVNTKVTKSGLIMASYRRAGEVRTGDYAMDPPTDAEVARRKKLKLEG